MVSFISKSTPNSAAAETISAFFILASADLDNILDFVEADSTDEVLGELSVEGDDTFASSFFSNSLVASESSDLPNNLEKKPFFFVSFVSLIT